MKNNVLCSLFLTTALLTALLGGCGSRPQSSSEASASEPATSVEQEPAAPKAQGSISEAPVSPSEAIPESEVEPVQSSVEEEKPVLDLTASSYAIRLIQNGTAEAQLDINSGRVQEIFLYSDVLGSEAEFIVDEVTDESVCTAVTHGPNLTISGAKAGTADVKADSTDADGNVYNVTVHVAVNDEGKVAFQDLTSSGEGPGGAGGPPPDGAGGPPPDGVPLGLGSVDETMEPGGIMFCGSSLMGGFDVGTYLAEDGYDDISIGNVTMGGTTIADFAEAQQENIISMKPGAIFINIGSVDIDRIASGVFDMQFMHDSYESLLTALRDGLPDCNIYVMAYYPSRENTFRPNALVDQCNVWVEELANDLGLNFVNVSDVLKNDRGYLRDEFSADGIHLTDEAYRLVYAELKPDILASIGLD